MLRIETVSRILRLLILLPLLTVAGACAAPEEDPYVPGGNGLEESARRRYREAVRLERNGRGDEALTLLARLCTEYPLRVGLHLHRLRLARDLKGPEYAAGLYDPPPPGVDSERAGVLAELARVPEDDPARGKAVLEYATEREPDEPFWHLGLADIDVTAHDLKIERAIAERELGGVRVGEEYRDEARKLLKNAKEEAARAVELNPGLAEGHLMLGYIATRTADLAADGDERDKLRTEGRAHFEEALKLDPQSLEARIDLAETFLYFNQYNDAAKQLERASRLAPKDPRVWNNLGYTYHAVGQLEDAIKCYERVLRFAPGDVRARVSLSDCERRRGQTKEAVKELKKARSESQDDKPMLAIIAFKLAAIHEFEGRYKQAVEEYERAIELGSKESAKARSRVRHIYEHAFE
jgi:tetratricopeptide (TPR) repeat protein